MINVQKDSIVAVMRDGTLRVFLDGNDGKGGEYQTWVRTKDAGGISSLLAADDLRTIVNEHAYQRFEEMKKRCKSCIDGVECLNCGKLVGAFE